MTFTTNDVHNNITSTPIQRRQQNNLAATQHHSPTFSSPFDSFVVLCFRVVWSLSPASPSSSSSSSSLLPRRYLLKGADRMHGYQADSLAASDLFSRCHAKIFFLVSLSLHCRFLRFTAMSSDLRPIDALITLLTRSRTRQKQLFRRDVMRRHHFVLTLSRRCNRSVMCAPKSAELNNLFRRRPEGARFSHLKLFQICIRRMVNGSVNRCILKLCRCRRQGEPARTGVSSRP